MADLSTTPILALPADDLLPQAASALAGQWRTLDERRSCGIPIGASPTPAR